MTMTMANIRLGEDKTMATHDCSLETSIRANKSVVREVSSVNDDTKKAHVFCEWNAIQAVIVQLIVQLDERRSSQMTHHDNIQGVSRSLETQENTQGVPQ
jgi:hypothetical protein